MFRIVFFTTYLRVVSCRVIHHLKRGIMKGKTKRVGSVKMNKKKTKEHKKARAEIRTRVGGSTVL